jgi:hypothetical protein
MLLSFNERTEAPFSHYCFSCFSAFGGAIITRDIKQQKVVDNVIDVIAKASLPPRRMDIIF